MRAVSRPQWSISMVIIFSSRRRHTRCLSDWSSDVCSSDLLLIEDQAYTNVAIFMMSEPDIALALQQPWVSICNDSEGTAPDGLLGKEHPHPRAYGTFPRILRKYVREEKKLTLPDAIRKFSALP